MLSFYSMTILDYYIFREVAKVFLISLFTILAALALEKVSFLSSLFLSQSASASLAGWLLLYLCPSFLTLAIPLAALMASLMAFSRMASDNEITAMRAGGISFARLLAPVLLFSGLASLAALYLSVYVAHEGNLRFQQTAMKILGQTFQTGFKERRFYSDFPGLMIYVKSNKDGRLEGVFISDGRREGDENIIEAKTGVITFDQESGVVTMGLRDGVIHSTGQGYRTIAFGEYVLRMDLGHKLNQPVEKELPHLSLEELAQVIESKTAQGKPAFRETVEVHKKFAIPLGALALGAMGAMAAALTHRRGSSGGFGLGVILIAINYLLIMTGQSLGAGGKIPPVAGVWAPDIIMAAAAALIYQRISKDSMPTAAELWLAQAWKSLRLYWRRGAGPA